MQHCFLTNIKTKCLVFNALNLVFCSAGVKMVSKASHSRHWSKFKLSLCSHRCLDLDCCQIWGEAQTLFVSQVHHRERRDSNSPCLGRTCWHPTPWEDSCYRDGGFTTISRKAHLQEENSGGLHQGAARINVREHRHIWFCAEWWSILTRSFFTLFFKTQMQTWSKTQML